MSASISGIGAFNEKFWAPSTSDDTDYGDWTARRQRYAAGWASFANNAYRDINSWAPLLKERYKLHVHIRNIQSPGFRLGDFWSTHLMGGELDPEAGDGMEVPSALPILVPESNAGNEDRLRAAIAQLFENSNWEEQKDVLTQQGSIQGDTGIEVVDDPVRKKAYLRIVDPAVIKSVDKDDFGHVKGYVREESRKHPERSSQDVTYTEIVINEGGKVVYQTFLNGRPYDWTGQGAQWEVPYGFVPLVMIQHMNVGAPWGWSALYPIWSKVMEIDDLASILDDQIRIMLNAPMLLAGVEKPKTTPRFQGDTTTENPRGSLERDAQRFLYGPKEASATPLIMPLDIAATSARIDSLTKEIERDAPELDMDIYTGGGDAASGRALRVRRQRVETKVRKIRRGYDKPTTRAIQMAVAIGGERNYEGFTGFSLKSYAAGELDFRIGGRPVFESDPTDIVEDKKLQQEVIQLMTGNGYPLEYARQQVEGASEEDLDEMRVFMERDPARIDVAFGGG